MDDKKHGIGTFLWPDGRRYVGDWVNGKQHGKGIFNRSDTGSVETEWKEGKRVKVIFN